MDIVKPAFRLKRLAQFACLVKINAVFNEFCAVSAHRAVFLSIVPVRHDNRGCEPELCRRIRDGLPMIPARRRNNTECLSISGGVLSKRAVLFPKVVHEIQAAAHLKTACRQMVLVLDVGVKTEPLG